MLLLVQTEILQCILFLFNLFFKTHIDHIFIYTDGSIEGVGAAPVTTEREKHYHLPDNFSIYSVEKYALLQALQTIELQELQHPYATSYTYPKHFQHKIKQADLIFLWIPSHIDVDGNKEADITAK